MMPLEPDVASVEQKPPHEAALLRHPEFVEQIEADRADPIQAVRSLGRLGPSCLTLRWLVAFEGWPPRLAR